MHKNISKEHWGSINKIEFYKITKSRINKLSYIVEKIDELYSNFKFPEDYLKNDEFWMSVSVDLKHSLKIETGQNDSDIRTRRDSKFEKDIYSRFKETELQNISFESFVDCLIEIHKSLNLNGISEIRKTDVGTLEWSTGKFVKFLPPECIYQGLQELFEYTVKSQNTKKSFINVIYFYCRLLNIHPFNDGNGRVSRCLFMILAKPFFKKSDFFIPLSEIIYQSNGGFEIRLRDGILNGNWNGLIDYFCTALQIFVEIPSVINSNSSILKKTDFNMQIYKLHDYATFNLIDRIARSESTPYISSIDSGELLALLCIKDKERVGNYLERKTQLIQKICSGYNNVSLNCSLYSGISGLGFLLKYCVIESESKQYNELINDIDEILEDQVSNVKNPNIDIIKGIAGILIYASIQVGNNPSGKTLKLILVEKAERIFDSWITSDLSSRLPFNQASNLGLSHGIPGLLLSYLMLKGKELSESESSRVYYFVKKLLGFKIESKYGLTFPNYFDKNEKGRIAWCYGPLGICILLNECCKIGHEFDEYLNTIISSVINQIDDSAHMILDYGICHGWAGLLLIFDNILSGGYCNSENTAEIKRIIQLVTEDIKNKQAENYPFKKILKGHAYTDYSVLEGELGICLVLDSIEGKLDKRWSKILGLNYEY